MATLVNFHILNATAKKWHLPVKEFYVSAHRHFKIKPFGGIYYSGNVFLGTWLCFFVSIRFANKRTVSP
jgi:hypothetical protein